MAKNDDGKPNPYEYGYISPTDGRMWDGKRWIAPTADVLAARGQAQTDGANWGRVSTLPTIPGYTITESLGVVSVLTSASGWTASSKGNDALNQAQVNLLDSATARGANAVVGLTSSSFGAGGGITSAFGGDAVGILLMGTAVRVDKDPTESHGPLAG